MTASKEETRDPSDPKGMKVYARRGSKYRKTMGPGVVVGTRSCNLEGCRGLRLITRWPSGKRTMPCTKGMRPLGKTSWEIV